MPARRSPESGGALDGTIPGLHILWFGSMTISRPWPGAARLLIAALVLLLSASSAFGQAWPAKQIRLIVPWPAGGTVDGVARVIGPKLSAALGQPVIIDNKGGAGGSIGEAEVAKAPADGHTLIAVFDTHAVNHLLYKKLAYDPFASFEHVSLLVTSPQILVAATNFAPSTLAELVAYAKANPGKVTYATVGTGSSNHLNAVFFSSRAGIDMLHIPYKGGAPMMTDMLGGQVNAMFVSAPQALPQIKAGRIKALATGSAKRMAQLPDTPTVAESLPGFRAQSWVGLLAPAGTPKDIVARLHRELVRILADPEVSAKLGAQGFDIVGSTPEEFLAFTHAESEKWAKVIRDFDVRVD
jgi:tripartite-type tricarboxylate transporter receptor subunit TctC